MDTPGCRPLTQQHQFQPSPLGKRVLPCPSCCWHCYPIPGKRRPGGRSPNVPTRIDSLPHPWTCEHWFMGKEGDVTLYGKRWHYVRDVEKKSFFWTVQVMQSCVSISGGCRERGGGQTRREEAMRPWRQGLTPDAGRGRKGPSLERLEGPRP